MERGTSPSIFSMAITMVDGTQPAQSRIRYGRSLTVGSSFYFSYLSVRIAERSMRSQLAETLDTHWNGMASLRGKLMEDKRLNSFFKNRDSCFFFILIIFSSII